VVPVVVDTDGRVWASDGTRDADNLRACLGAAATAWAKTQVDAKTFPIAVPAVVYGKVVGKPAATEGNGRSLPRPTAK
jgi:hypothetical protein